MNALVSIGGDHVQETQFRGFASWNNEDFRLAHADGLDITVIDISGLTDDSSYTVGRNNDPTQDLLLCSNAQ